MTQQKYDYAEAARLDCLNPVRPGHVNGQAFWNHFSTRFMYAPSFQFEEIPGAKVYRYTTTDRFGHTCVFDADSPWATLTPVWDRLPVGRVDLTVDAYDACGALLGRCTVDVDEEGADGKFHTGAKSRSFYRNAAFNNAYPPKKRPYAESARMALNFLFELPSIQHWKTGKPDPDYLLNSYPSKIHSSIIRGMIKYAAAVPDRAEEAIDIARKAADYLIATSLPAESALPNFPLTYEGNRMAASTKNGTIMIIYPADVGETMLMLAEKTGEKKYLDCAVRIGETYLKLQLPNGSWHLILNIKDGSHPVENCCEPSRIFTFLLKLWEKTGNPALRAAVERGVPYLDTMIRSFDWAGQFEDVGASWTAYNNLSKHMATDVAMFLKQYRPDDPAVCRLAREVLRFSEDQFIVWEQPGWVWTDNMFCDRVQNKTWGWYAWHTPAVLEQYLCYAPIDASAAKMIRTYLMLYEQDRNPLDLAKARALADSITRIQEDGGRIPTGFKQGPPNPWGDWINCMFASVAALEECAEYDAVQL